MFEYTLIHGHSFESKIKDQWCENIQNPCSSVGSCQLTVNKCTDTVCQVKFQSHRYFIGFQIDYNLINIWLTFQLRLDFSSMTLAQPESTDNKCSDDQFIGEATCLVSITEKRPAQYLQKNIKIFDGNSIFFFSQWRLAGASHLRDQHWSTQWVAF